MNSSSMGKSRNTPMVIGTCITTHPTHAGCVLYYGPSRPTTFSKRGSGGDPIVFPFSMRRKIRALAGGLRMLAEGYPNRGEFVETSDARALQDTDTRNDLEIL